MGEKDRISYKDLQAYGGLEGLLTGKSTRRPGLRPCVDGQPPEEAEQLVLAEYLNTLKFRYHAKGLLFLWNHNPHGGKRPKGEGGKLAAAGASKGVPDNYIYTPPPAYPDTRGVAIELKRASTGIVSKDQKEWLDNLNRSGWIVAVCHGADEAIQFVKSLGYEDLLQPDASRDQNIKWVESFCPTCYKSCTFCKCSKMNGKGKKP